MSKKIKAGIIGATGLAGEGVLDILINHPQVEISVLTSDSSTDKDISQVIPKYKKVFSHKLIDTNISRLAECDIIFMTKKDPESMKLVKPLLEGKCKIIDLGGEFRLADYRIYEEWYKHEHLAKDLLAQAVYGLPELNKEKIVKARLIANPGCYPTGNILAISPLVKAGLIDQNSISIVAYSGISGAGRTYSSSSANLFVSCNENIRAYGIGDHKHTPEIEQGISNFSGKTTTLLFIPHLSPMDRGIFSTITALPTETTSNEGLIKTLQQTYANSEFVRVFEDPKDIQVSNVRYTNYCDISAKLDKRTNRVMIFAVIDNLTKGAASQAVQNMNLLFNLDEGQGIRGKI